MLEKLLRWSVICGVFATPLIALVFDLSMVFPYFTAQNLAFRIIVEIIVGAWLVLALFYTKYRPRHSWILGAFALFVTIMAIADVHGVYPYKSFWSSYARMDGWVTLVHVFAYLVVASAVISSERLWKLLFKFSLGVSAIESIYGFFQIAGLRPFGLQGGAGFSLRIDGTFGVPSYLAVYMLFNIFIAALLWNQRWVARPSKSRLSASLTYAAIIFLDTLALLLTETRGTLLGLVVGASLALIILALAHNSRRLRLAAIAAVIIILLSSSFLFLARNTPFVQNVGFVNRLAHISLNDPNVRERLLIYGIAWQGVKERPMLGWGQENFEIVYQKHFDPRLYFETAYADRAHDIVLDWLISGGFLGLAAYVSIFVASVWILWRSGRFTSTEKSILTGLLAAYVIQNLVIFDSITSYILFATVLAYIVFRGCEGQQEEQLFKQAVVPEEILPVLIATVAIAVVIAAWWINAAAFAANRTLYKAFLKQDSPLTTLTYLKQAIAYGSFGTDEARQKLTELTLGILGQQAVPDDTKHQCFDASNHELQVQSEASPLDARYPLYRGTLFAESGDYAGAAALLQHAHELAPNMQIIIYIMAEVATTQGNLPQALTDYKQAYDLDPSNPEAKQSYVAALQAAENANPSVKPQTDNLIQQIESGTNL
jgi:O-antigen ligase